MSTLRNCIGFCFGLALMLSPGLAAELEPNWDEPAVARARSAVDTARAARPSAEATNRDAEAQPSLPRWGLGTRLDRPTSDEQSRARTTTLPSANISAWPSCAKQSPDVTPLVDKSQRR